MIACPMTACELYRLARDAEAAYVAHLKRQFGADYNNGRYLRTWQARYDVFTSRAAADWHGLVSCYYTEVGNPAAAQDHADRVKEHQVRMWRAVAW